MIKIAFFGTPNIGASALKSLLNSSQIEVVVVVTNIDKPIGRSHSKFEQSEVAKIATKNGLDIIKTSSINKEIDKLRKFEFDYIVTCAFGQFLSNDILNLPKKKSLNIHGSLLPEGRGGAPIHWSIIKGKKETGISIMEMVSKMDAGNYFLQYKINIDEDETTDDLFKKMENLIFQKTASAIIEINKGIKSIVQNEDEVSFWLNIKKDDAKIDFNFSIIDIHNKIRGLYSKPGAWANLDNKIVKINSAKKTNFKCKDNRPGLICDVTDNGLIVATKDFYIYITSITISGEKKRFITKNDKKVFLNLCFN